MFFFDSSFVPHTLGRVRILCAYIFFSIQFISIHFISILFYSAWRKKRNVTNDNEKNEKNENYEILRKKGNTLIKNHVSVIFYAKTVYFFIHSKNVFIAFFLFFRSFSFFSFVFLFFVNFVFIRYLWITIFLLNKRVFDLMRFFSISKKN